MHIFMILCDELRADVLGYAGGEVKTPNIDALAQDSAVFSNSCCNTPMCVPSRVSLATGQYPLTHGVLDNMMGPQDGAPSLYTALQDAGYVTINYGKWHSNIAPEKFGVSHSDTCVDKVAFPETAISCFGISDSTVRRQSRYTKNQGEISLIVHGTRPNSADETLDGVVTQHYLTAVEEALQKLSFSSCATNRGTRVAAQSAELSDKKSLFARLSIHDPHTPYFPAEPYASMYNPTEVALPGSWNENLMSKPLLQRYFHKARGFDQLTEEDYRKSRAAYYGLVSHVDKRVGEVVAKLKDLGVYDESLIIFTSDHGSMQGEHGYIEKWGHMYEPVERTPLLIKFPTNGSGNAGACGGGEQFDSFVESVDIMPTLLDICGLPIPAGVDGKSVLPYIRGESAIHKTHVYAQYFAGGLQTQPALMVRDAKWKLTWYPEGNCIEQRLPMDHPLRNSDFFDNPDVLGELYDMEADPEETNNLYDSAEHVEIRECYLKKLQAWIAETGYKTDPKPDKPESFVAVKLGMYQLLQANNMKLAEVAVQSEIKRFHE